MALLVELQNDKNTAENVGIRIRGVLAAFGTLFRHKTGKLEMNAMVGPVKQIRPAVTVVITVQTAFTIIAGHHLFSHIVFQSGIHKRYNQRDHRLPEVRGILSLQAVAKPPDQQEDTPDDSPQNIAMRQHFV